MFTPRRLIRSWARALLLCSCCVVCGCGDSGPQRYPLSGTITYDGKPISFGWIVFAPQQGPGASANIEDGRYETPPGFGTIGGPHTIEVVAFDTPIADENFEEGTNSGSQPMFTYKFTDDIPAGSTTWDIEITPDDLTQPNVPPQSR